MLKDQVLEENICSLQDKIKPFLWRCRWHYSIKLLGPMSNSNQILSSLIFFLLSNQQSAVRDITWLSDQSVHLAKWMHALEQVTDGHLVQCPLQLTTWSSVSKISKMYQISDFHEQLLPKGHTSALSQVISLTGLYYYIQETYWVVLGRCNLHILH